MAAHNVENPGEHIKVRIGLHTGKAIKEGEDLFGKSVILAARIASQAGEQILVSSLLKALVREQWRVRVQRRPADGVEGVGRNSSGVRGQPART